MRLHRLELWCPWEKRLQGNAARARRRLRSRLSGRNATGEPGSDINNDVARLAGARVVCAVETKDGKRFAEARLKALTGGDTISARFLHREFFEFVPQFKLWLMTNHKRDDPRAKSMRSGAVSV